MYFQTVYNDRLKGNLTYYSIVNEAKREIIVAFAADEPTGKQSSNFLKDRTKVAKK